VTRQRPKILGLHEVEWREVGEEPTHEPNWYRNKTCPAAGEQRWANIRQRHQTALSERVWLLYQPALSLCNGWDEHPAELDTSAIVECEICDRFDTDWSYHPIYRGWVKVVCHRVVRLTDIPNYFPPTQSNDIYADDGSMGDYRGETSKLLYLTRQYQEAAHWWVITKTIPARLVLACLDIYDSPFEICNFVVPRPEKADRPLTLVDTIREDIKDTATKEMLHFIGEWHGQR
jgi:hypothetical protein